MRMISPIRACVALAVAVTATGAYAADDNDEDTLPLEGRTSSLAFSTDEGSWLSLTVAPDGESLVFDLLGDLYRLPTGGGRATRITEGLGFDSQPALSPDGEWLAFVSDRSGSDNLWISRPDGSDARQLSDEKHWGIVSPAWTPDSDYIVVTRTALKPEFTLYHVDGGDGVRLAGTDADEEIWGVGATVSPDGRYLYFAQVVDSDGPVEDFPATQVSRYDFDTGAVDPVTGGEGGGMRPVLSPDGRLLAYVTRHDSETGLRLRNLATGEDRWLAWPVQRDAQENGARQRPPSRDLFPGYAFTPDGGSVVYFSDGRFRRVDVGSGESAQIPFTADVELAIGPDLSSPYRVADLPETATLIHDPVPSPDGRRVAASVLGVIHVQERGSGQSAALTPADALAFKPAWSPDGRWLAYVTWSADTGGHVYRVRANGRGNPERLTRDAAFYTDLAYAPDGRRLYAMRGNAYMRGQRFSEFTGLGIPLDLVSLPADGGPVTTIVAGRGARYPHFGGRDNRLYLYDPERGLVSLQLDGTDIREELVVTGPRGNRRGEDPPKAERVRLSPDGRYALALVNKQVWVVAGRRTGGVAPTVDVTDPALPAVRLTDIGADFLGWSADGASVHWAIGSTWYTRPFDSIDFAVPAAEENGDDAPFVPRDRHASVERVAFEMPLELATPGGEILLRGARLIAMSGATTEEMARLSPPSDVLVRGNRIALIASAGSIVPAEGAEVVDLSGRFLVPGFIDTHAHWEFRTGDVLEPHNWSLAANLAYGVTAGLDVQTSHKDYFAYRDFQRTGQSIGQRAFMTGEGVFGYMDFDSYDAAHAFLRRYSDHYRTKNIKAYLTGNRRQRQWVVLAAQALGLMPTTEGGGDQKLDLTHAIDGMHGNEHTLPDSPLYRDVVELYARTKTAYTPTLIVQYNAEPMREYFFTRTDLRDNEKLARFYPQNRLDELTARRPGWQRNEEFRFRQAAADAARIQRAGGLVGVGGHAELQGLGYHWEMWAYAMGGMTPAEVLRAATIDGAAIIGIAADLGSIEAGKLADLVVLTANPLEDIRNTEAIEYVMQDGRLYDGDTLDQLWPDARALPPFWWWNDADRRYAPAPPARRE